MDELKDDKRVIVAQNWWKAWNERDIEALMKLIAPNSRLATLFSLFDPIIIDDRRLEGTEYVRARFEREIGKLNNLNISFRRPEKILVGELFVELRYYLSDGTPVREILSLDKDYLIDQVMRDISYTAWV
ncbi:hypothetical protein L3K75_14135 [[Ruminococcus] lactaris]|nr:hypothetical protein [[Ruminococcus] lactaris]